MSIPPNPDPLALFEAWFQDAKSCATIAEPTAVTLATVDDEGQPWPRVVLLKDYDRDGFVFYTNTHSYKGRHLYSNPRAGLCFHWMPLGKQVRIIGLAHPVAPEEADTYFASRPRESQLGAWASNQSAPLPSRAHLDQRFAEFEKEFKGEEVPRPPHWSGYRIVPHTIEFWLLAPNRLHHRRVYYRVAGGAWTQQMLYP
jgi:pyridoxamine 5'-phosphate oxidase